MILNIKVKYTYIIHCFLIFKLKQRFKYAIIYNNTLSELSPEGRLLKLDDKLPGLEPWRTAVFALSCGKLNVPCFFLDKKRRAVRRDIRWLLERGYSCFIVSCANAYGQLALLELLELQRCGVRFRLYAVEVEGETMPKKAAWQTSPNGYSLIRCSPAVFVSRILRHTSIICSPQRRFLCSGELPQEILDYYKRLP